MNGHLSIGVIGHVDHGKTSLVKALTGIETDRLAEERERGLTIVLGFAHLETPSGLIDFIDAPGHADFVRTMISGATGIDAALVVIAASEGVMPQTAEHLRIISLLGIDQIVVALTKTDLIDADALDAKQAAIQAELAEMGFKHAVLIPVCAPKDEGLEDLVAALEALFAVRRARPDTGRFYLPFDRVFTMPGFGTVVTGTLRGGSLRVGDDAEIPDLGIEATVRRLEVHGAEADRAESGQRVAVNLRVTGGPKLSRGQALASPGWLAPSEWWSATLRMAGDVEAKLRNGKPVRLLHGTSEIITTLRLLDRDEIAPGERANVQFRLRPPEAAWDQDHFIVRTVTPVETVGGGHFVDTKAKRIPRHDSEGIKQLAAVSGDDEASAILATAEQAGADGISLEDLAKKVSLPAADVTAALTRSGALISDEGLVLAPNQAASLSARVLDHIRRYHADYPLRTGLARLELIDQIGIGRAAGDLVVAGLAASGKLAVAGDRISEAGFDPLGGLSDSEKVRVEFLEARLRETPLMPPTMDELTTADKRDGPRAELLIEIGRVVPLWDFKRKNLFLFHAAEVEKAVDALRQSWPPPGKFRLGEARERLSVTRKYLQPLLEHFDKQKITRRREDFREFL